MAAASIALGKSCETLAHEALRHGQKEERGEGGSCTHTWPLFLLLLPTRLADYHDNERRKGDETESIRPPLKGGGPFFAGKAQRDLPSVRP